MCICIQTVCHLYKKSEGLGILSPTSMDTDPGVGGVCL